MVKQCLILILGVLFLGGCSSGKKATEWRKPDTEDYHVSKVLVMGLSQFPQVRETYETAMVERLQKEGIDAARSMDVLDNSIDQLPKTVNELNQLEKEVIREDFDGVLITKVVGKDEKKSVGQAVKGLARLFDTFGENVSEYQSYIENESYEPRNYDIYHVASYLYCYCLETGEGNLLWRSNIDIVEPELSIDEIKDKGIKNYTRKAANSLKKQNLIRTN